MPAMDTYYPFDAGPGSIDNLEERWRLIAQNWIGDGVIAEYAGALAVFGDSTGLQVKVPTGAAAIRGHRGELTAQRTVAIAPNASGNPRIDRVVVRLEVVANTVGVEVVQGTPAASPAAPALTRNATVWEFSLGQVLVANGAATITAGNVTDERPIVSPAIPGTLFPSIAARDVHYPAPPNGVRAFLGDGTGWVRLGGAWSPDRDLQVFTTSGTWTKPAGLSSSSTVTLIGVAPGGPGASGARGAVGGIARRGGAGGNGGERAISVVAASLLGATETVTIGTPGTGGPPQTVDGGSAQPGTASGNVSFGSVFLVRGGAAALGSNAAASALGGTYGLGGTASTGFVASTGQNGSAHVGPGGGAGAGIDTTNVAQAAAAGGASSAGLAGGAAGSSTAAGSPGASAGNNGATGSGGGGGGSNGTIGRDGGAGGFPGGGGGGGGASTNGTNSGAGGAGGAGLLIVIAER